jgi:Holliday junction resolvase-like predicted endonuclease
LSIERILLISLLKLSQNGAVERENVNLDARLPSSITSTLLKKLQNENLLYIKDDLIEVNSECRLALAVKAIELGTDVERTSDFLRWQEFEAMAAISLELSGYATKKNVRFKQEGKRWEIDVIGFRKPLVLCIDCKHWRHGMHPSTLKKMAVTQAKRVNAFANSLPTAVTDFACVKWDQAKFVPIILSLVPFADKFCNDIPIVPVLALQDFVSQLPLNLECLRYSSRKFNHL